MFAYFVDRLRRRSLMLVVVVALLAAMMPTAAFAYHGGGHVQWSRQPVHQYYYVRKPVKPHVYYCSVAYRVRKGDTLSKIALHYRTTVRYLAHLNRIPNPNKIYAGQVICIR
jgi:nucleoid-associated protein YgaU